MFCSKKSRFHRINPIDLEDDFYRFELVFCSGPQNVDGQKYG